MKAAQLESNGKIEIRHINESPLADDECKIKITHAGLCSSDIPRSQKNGAYFYPLIMGHELVGEVKETGSKVLKCKAGDKIAVFPLLPCFTCEACKRKVYAQCHNYCYYGSRTHGGFAEFLNVKEWNLLKLPSSVSLKDAVAIEPMAVALHTIHKANLLNKPAQNIVIIGSGFIGLLMAQIIKLQSPQHQVTLIDNNPQKKSIAENYVDHFSLLENDDKWNHYIKEHRFDTVIEASGAPVNYARTIQLTTNNGNVVWMSNVSGDVLINQKIISSILRKELSIVGVWNSIYNPQAFSDEWKESLSLLEKGTEPSKLVTHWISLDELPEMISNLFMRKVDNLFVKAVVTF